MVSALDAQTVTVLVTVDADTRAHLSQVLLSLAGQEHPKLEVGLLARAGSGNAHELVNELEQYAHLGGFRILGTNSTAGSPRPTDAPASGTAESPSPIAAPPSRSAAPPAIPAESHSATAAPPFTPTAGASPEAEEPGAPKWRGARKHHPDSELLAVTTGRYLAFLDARWRIYPDHFLALQERLQQTNASWSMARAFQAITRDDDAFGYVEAKRPFPLGEPFDPEQTLRTPALLHASLFDRERLTDFDLARFASHDAHDRHRAWAELVGRSPPNFLGGLPSCEVVDRGELMLETAQVPDVPYVITTQQLLDLLATSRERTLAELGPAHHALQKLLETAKTRAPGLHRALKSAAARAKRNR